MLPPPPRSNLHRGVRCRYALKGLDNNWRWMLAVGALPPVLILLFLLCLPESPRWLVGQGRAEEAGQVLARTSGKSTGCVNHTRGTRLGTCINGWCGIEYSAGIDLGTH